jgi:BolA protein
MNRKKRIETIIKSNFIYDFLNVLDDSHLHAGHQKYDGTQESHFKIIIKLKAEIQLTRLQVHQKINDLLKDEFSIGLHALQIQIIK